MVGAPLMESLPPGGQSRWQRGPRESLSDHQFSGPRGGTLTCISSAVRMGLDPEPGRPPRQLLLETMSGPSSSERIVGPRLVEPMFRRVLHELAGPITWANKGRSPPTEAVRANGLRLGKGRTGALDLLEAGV